MPEDTVRVLRIIEYVGIRSKVEATIKHSIHGEKVLMGLTIRAATIGTYPEILSSEDSNDSRS